MKDCSIFWNKKLDNNDMDLLQPTSFKKSMIF
jgi:hypothetical protein